MLYLATFETIQVMHEKTLRHMASPIQSCHKHLHICAAMSDNIKQPPQWIIVKHFYALKMMWIYDNICEWLSTWNTVHSIILFSINQGCVSGMHLWFPMFSFVPLLSSCLCSMHSKAMACDKFPSDRAAGRLPFERSLGICKAVSVRVFQHHSTMRLQ